MRLPSRRTGNIAGILAAVIAMVGTGAAVTAASYSVFNSTTANPSNSWTTGSVLLTDDDSNGAMFTAAGIAPSTAAASKCIAVTSSGTLASTVKLYSTGYAFTNPNVGSSTVSLGTYINLTIQVGTVGSFSSCGAFTGTSIFSNTLDNFNTTYSSFATGLSPSWAPTGTAPETKVFKFTWSPVTTMPNTVQSANVQDTFTWEAQSN